MFFVGLSAGGLIISSVPKALGIKGFGGISKVAIWTSVCCTVLAIGFVVVDLGQPARLWELFAYSNLGSPLMWDIIVLAVYLIPVSYTHLPKALKLRAMNLAYEGAKDGKGVLLAPSSLADGFDVGKLLGED